MLDRKPAEGGGEGTPPYPDASRALAPAAAPATVLAGWMAEARERTFAFLADLSDHQLEVPLLPVVNPLLWEVGHVAWFQEKWILREALGQPPLRADGDRLYDSSAVAHDTRWGLPLPSRQESLDYLGRVRDRVLAVLAAGEPAERVRYFVLLSLFHEDMHAEAFLYMRQTLGLPAPALPGPDPVRARTGLATGPWPGDVAVSGGELWLGSPPTEPFVFDNEKWAHRVAVEPFHIARAPVTQGEFAAFVDAGGYREKALWGDDGGRFLAATEAAAPVYWRRGAGGWERRCFDRWVALEPHQPMVHLSWFEARAFCRWAGRRLPSEAEWELAAAGTPATGPTTPEAKRRFPWGGGLPVTDPRGVQPCANLDGWALGPVDVAACATGDSAFGCRQMIGNVWEWTASTFEPYPGFSADPYEDYSQPWFGSRKVLRGGAWATRGRMLRNAWRNYFTPDRRDVPAGFRTCAGSEVGASTGRAS